MRIEKKNYQPWKSLGYFSLFVTKSASVHEAVDVMQLSNWCVVSNGQFGRCYSDSCFQHLAKNNQCWYSRYPLALHSVLSIVYTINHTFVTIFPVVSFTNTSVIKSRGLAKHVNSNPLEYWIWAENACNFSTFIWGRPGRTKNENWNTLKKVRMNSHWSPAANNLMKLDCQNEKHKSH